MTDPLEAVSGAMAVYTDAWTSMGFEAEENVRKGVFQRYQVNAQLMALAAKGLEVDRRKLQLAEPIKKLGDFDIPLKLHREVVATVKLKVVAEGASIK